MSDAISITLEGKLAIDYMNFSNKEANMTTRILKADEYIKSLEEQIEFLQNRLDLLADNRTEDTPSDRVTRDTQLAKDLVGDMLDDFEGPMPTFIKPKQVTPVEIKAVETKPKKFKSRLSNKDKKELSDLAFGKTYSECSVIKFAKKRNLSPKTVVTYVNKHCTEPIEILSGKNIAKHQVWAGSNLNPDEQYFVGF